jgi:hypothetical protein
MGRRRPALGAKETAMLKSAVLAASALIAVAPAAHAATAIGDVFYIAMENHNWVQPSSVTGISQIFGNSAAPYINSLVTPGNPNAALVSYASNYQNVPGIHPSEPNYVWMEAGRAGPLNDSDPYPNNIVSGPNLSAILQSSGSSWRSYQEDTDLLTTTGQNINMPGVTGNLTNTVAATSQYTVPLTSFSGTSSGYTNAYNGSNQYNYAPKHDPQVFFTATNGGPNSTASNPQSQNYAPLQQLQSDLNNNTVGRYNFITPDQYNDMHSALSTSFTYNGVTYAAGSDLESIALGDNFLSRIIPMIEASAAFQNNGEIVIWNDETEGEGNPPQSGFSSMEIVISPLAKGNAYTNNILYTHSNDLNTLQDIFGLRGTPLGGAAGAYSMIDLYKAGAFSVPEPGTWALMFVGLFGLGGALRMRRQRGFAAA